MNNIPKFKQNPVPQQFKQLQQQQFKFPQLQCQTITIDAKTYRKFTPPLGEGTEGVVYKGQNVQTNEIVAIKEYKLMNQNELKAIQAIQRNNFTNIIRITGVQVKQNYLPIVVMEFANGEFYQFMQTPQYTNLSYKDKNLYFVQMMEGLEQLHSLGLFHRDVKPENFVYIKDPNDEITIKLIDFGLVKENKGTLQTSKVGTPYYMAPEVFGGQNNSYDKSVDIWSLGAIWYELLTNETFFNGNTQEEIFLKIKNITQQNIDRQIQENDIIQEDEKRFIQQMLQIIPSKRISLKEVIQFYIDQFMKEFQLFLEELFKRIKDWLYDKLYKQQINLRNKLNLFKQAQLEKVKKANQIEFEKKLTILKEIEGISGGEGIRMKFQIQIEEEQKKIEIHLQEILITYDSKVQEKILQKTIEFSEKIEKELDEIKKQSKQNLNYQIQNRNEENKKSILLQSELQVSDEMEQYKKQKEEEVNQDFETFTESEKENIQEIVEQSKNLKQTLIEKLGKDIENTIESWKQQEQQKVIQKRELEKQKELQELEKKKELKELEDKKQQQIQRLDSVLSKIKNIIQYLTDKQQIIHKINLQDQKKLELLNFINTEIQNYEEIIQKYDENQKLILKALTKEMLKEQELTQEIEMYQKNHNDLIEKITKVQGQLEQQLKDKEKLELEEQKRKMEVENQMKIEQEQKLKNEKQKVKYNCLIATTKQQINQQFSQIQKIQDQLTFYKSIQMQIQEEDKMQDVIDCYSKIKQDFQFLEFQGQLIQQFEQLQQQITAFQLCNNKLEEIQQAQFLLKTKIQDANSCIEQIDHKYMRNNHCQIVALNNELIDQQEKYNYFSKNQKYSNQIAQIIKQIGITFGQLDNLKQLISISTYVAYNEYTSTYSLILQSLESFKNQYNQLHEQIYNDQQIELKNQERIKKLEITTHQLNQFKQKMNQLKDQVKNLIKNEYCNNNDSQNLINTRLQKMDQIMMQQQEQFIKCTGLSLLDTCEKISQQIQQLEDFQRNLNEVELNEIEFVNHLELLIKKVGEENKSEYEKEILNLNNQLQTRYRESKKALQSIEFQFQTAKFDKNINKENLSTELEQEISNLIEFSQISQVNMQLLEQHLKLNNKNKGVYKPKIDEILNHFKSTLQQKGGKLDDIIKKVNQKQQEVKFCQMDENLINNYEQLKIQEEQLQINLFSINEKISNQQLNTQQLNELKEYILQNFADIDELMKKIPEKDGIQNLIDAFYQNLESYEKVVALINYIKQYNLTRYYERIKEKELSQKKKYLDNDYQKQFQNKQNEEQEENTKKEQEAQDILLRYENVLNKTYKKMTIEAMKIDKLEMEKQATVLMNLIIQKNQVRLRSKVKDQNTIKQIKQHYKWCEFSQEQLFEIIYRKIEN